MAEGNNNKNPFKIWETVGKELLTGVLHEVVEKNYLKLEDSEKKKFYDAELRDKPRVLEASLRRKRDEAGQVLAEVFFNKENLPTDCKVLPESKVELDESADTLKPCPPEEFLRLCKERAGEVYPVKAKEDRTRLALIICNIAFESLPLRRGAEVDIEGMKTLLEDLGYSVHVEKHLTAQNMQSVLRAFAARPEHRSSDSTFLVFMSHGLLEGICGIKHNKQQPDVLLYDTIFQIFNNQNCGSLKDKPKVIIVQACRGDMELRMLEIPPWSQPTTIYNQVRIWRRMLFPRPMWRRTSLLSTPQHHTTYPGEVKQRVLSSSQNSSHVSKNILGAVTWKNYFGRCRNRLKNQLITCRCPRLDGTL